MEKLEVIRYSHRFNFTNFLLLNVC